MIASEPRSSGREVSHSRQTTRIRAASNLARDLLQIAESPLVMMARETHLTKEAIMTGVFEVAYKLLVNDKAKFTALLVGITFAVFLIVQMDAMFAGSMKRAFATVINLGASMWIM